MAASSEIAPMCRSKPSTSEVCRNRATVVTTLLRRLGQPVHAGGVSRRGNQTCSMPHDGRVHSWIAGTGAVPQAACGPTATVRCRAALPRIQTERRARPKSDKGLSTRMCAHLNHRCHRVRGSATENTITENLIGKSSRDRPKQLLDEELSRGESDGLLVPRPRPEMKALRTR
jgi:hypothetical protein